MPASQPDRTSPQALAEEPSNSDSSAVRGDPSGAGASLEQFRQVLEDQRRQTAQLQSLLEARFAGNSSDGGAADKVDTLVSKIESLASRIDSIGNGGNGHGGAEQPAIPPQVNGLMLRVGELERKISEATPEPLLKEIVFRLGSLEDAVGQTPDGGGIGEIRERVKALERQKAERSSADPRIDDLTARLAAMESAPRASDDARLGEILVRLQSLEEYAGQAVAEAGLEKLKEQIESLRAEVESGNLDGLKDIEARIASLENAPADSGGDHARLTEIGEKIAELTGIAERVGALESKAEEAVSGNASPEWEARLDAVESWGGRLAALEEKTAAPDPRIDELSTQLEKLGTLDSLAGRLDKLEEQAATPPRDPRLDEIQTKVASLTALTDRLETVESKAAEPPADPRFDGIESRLNSLEEVTGRVAALETKTAEPPADPRVDEIKARLGAMADVAHIGDVESRMSSLTTRLDALKMITDGLKATHKPGNGAAGPSVDALAARVDELKSLIAARDEASEAARAPAWDELLRRVETLENDGTPTAHDPRFTELAARLASLEKSDSGGADPRITEILARLNTMEQPKANSAAAIPPELTARIDAIEKRLSGAAATGSDPLVAQLRERWEILEERVMHMEESAPERGESGPTGDEIRAQVAELREKINALGDGDAPAGLDPEAVATLRELAKTGPAPSGPFDLKTVKSQMTFVYFSIGMLYAICAYAGYVMLSAH